MRKILLFVSSMYATYVATGQQLTAKEVSHFVEELEEQPMYFKDYKGFKMELMANGTRDVRTFKKGAEWFSFNPYDGKGYHYSLQTNSITRYMRQWAAAGFEFQHDKMTPGSDGRPATYSRVYSNGRYTLELNYMDENKSKTSGHFVLTMTRVNL